jgi:hypothetical protein
MTAAAPRGRVVRRVPRNRLALGALGLAALLAGLWAALLMLGLDVPTPRPDFAEVHGPLMVLGFLGTLSALERAVAIATRAGYLAPATAGLGGLALIAGLPLLVGQLLLGVAGVGLIGLYVAAGRKQTALHLWVMASGAVSWVVAVGLWLTGWDVGRLIPWLAGYLVLTITGERLELSRVGRLSRRAHTTFTTAAAVFGVGITVAIGAFSIGARIAGAGLLLLTVWLAAHDVARRTVRQSGLTRYMAACLLAGFCWLGVAGALWLRYGLAGGPAYDAMLHALFLGFVIGMVFAHAPVIVPAVFRAAVPYRRHFYGHLLLLHGSLLLRLVGGDLAGNRTAWQVGGVLNEVALLCFLAVTIAAVRQGRRGLVVAHRDGSIRTPAAASSSSARSPSPAARSTAATPSVNNVVS